MDNFLPLTEIAEQINKTPEAIRQWVYRGKIPEDCYAYISGDRGKSLYIHPSGVPAKYRSCFPDYSPQPNEPEEDELEIYSRLTDYQKEHVDFWLNLIKQFGDLKGKQLEEAIYQYQNHRADKRLSVKSFYRYRKAYREQGINGLVPKWGKRAGQTKVSDQDFELFKSYFLCESRPSPQSCWELVRGAAYREDRDISDFPSRQAFMNRLKKEVPESAIYLARHGEKAWNRKYADYISRDKSSINSNEVWVSDHRQLDIFVYNPRTGKAYRPWLTAWSCFKSNKFLAWFNHEDAPNSDHIFQSFKWGLEKFGAPGHIYLDNGKDYRARDFAGGLKYHKLEVEEIRCRSMIQQLGIEPHFSLPYNAQSKNIERAFRGLIEFLEKHLPGYTGADAKNRPEATATDIKKGRIIDEDTFNTLFDKFIEGLNNKPSEGKELQGKSPNELFHSEMTEKRVIRPEALKLFCMRTTKEATIMRNGVKDSQLGQRYWGEWMHGMKGKKVYLRRDLEAWQEAWVFDSQTDEFLGKAVLAAAANGLANSDLEKEQVRELISQKKREKKITKQYLDNLQRPAADETLQNFLAGVDAANAIRKDKGTYTEYDEDVKLNRLSNTKIDEAIHKADQLERTGTDDLSGIAPKKRKKKNIKLWED